jgi:hypothetical protein
LGAFGVGACLVADGLQPSNSFLQRWIGKVGDA